MTKTIKYFFFGLTLCFCHLTLLAQKSKIDSLKTLLKNDKEDTNKINHLNTLCAEFENNNPDTAIILCSQALSIAETLKWKKGITISCSNLGVCFGVKAVYHKALSYFLYALNLDEEQKDRRGMAIRLSNIGNIYKEQAEYPTALGYYFRAMKIDKELGDKTGIARHMGNIGIIYYHQGLFAEAKESLIRAEKMYEEQGLKIDLAINLVNLGSVYSDEADKLSGKKNSIRKDSLKQNSLNCYFSALKTFEELGNKNFQSVVLGNIGSLYTEAPTLVSPIGEEKKGFELAAKYIYRALSISDSLGAMDNVINWYQQLSILYEKSDVPLPDSAGGKLLNTEQMRVRALHYFKSYLILRDKIYSEENKRQLISAEMNFNFDKKEIAVRAEQEKKDEVAKIILKSVIGCMILIVVFAGLIFRSLYVTRKKKKIVEEKHKAAIQDVETFIYKASHDLKAPLSSIIGLIQITKAEIKDKKSIQYFQMIEEMTQKLNDMLLELVNNMKIKDSEDSRDEINFKEIINEATIKFKHTEEYARVKIYTTISLSSPFYSSKFILDTIFQNLIGNAFKYQNQKQQESFLKIGVTEENKKIKITVEDNGIGIEKSMQDKIFNMYYRANEQSKGSGLGLYLVKKGVERLNGEIVIDSTLGIGTTFIITFSAK